MDHCDACGFDYDLDDALNVAVHIVDGAAEMATLLTTHPDVRTRRQAGIWSPLEYGCHLRDVFLVQRERVLAARRMDCPSFDPMGRDERVEHDGYAQQDPSRVALQLTEAAFLFANALDRLAPDEWERTVIYNYPADMERSLRWVAVHTDHEVRHHLLDVRTQLE